jgi:uncharacterized protein (TIGR03435 family)
MAALFHPRKDSWPGHFSAHIGTLIPHGVEIRGLTPVGRATIRVLGLNEEMRQMVRYELWLEGSYTCGEVRKRAESIMTSWLARERALQRRMPVGAAALVAIWASVGIGLMTPQQTHAQSHVESSAAVAAAPAFEVASVKPSSPQARGIRMRHDPGMVDIRNFTLCDILAEAYNIDNQLISGPSWLSYERYDIVAKIPKGVPESQIPTMLQGLLKERFKLKVHRETKQTESYVLTVGQGGPKLEPAEDAPAASPNDSHATIAQGNASSSPSPPAEGFHLLDDLRPGELGFKAAGVTMAKLSDLLKAYVHSPVVDGTGLKGRYNLTFKFNTSREPEESGRPDYVPPSLLAAIGRLGLKLEARKVPLDHLVVDHVERIPIGN